VGTLYFGKQWLTRGSSCCFNNSGDPPTPARGFRLVSTGSGGGGLLTFGKTVGRGGDWFCDCGLISAPFTFTVHFFPDGKAPAAGGCCLLYENSFQDEILIIRYELSFCSETDDFGFFTFKVGDDADGPTDTIIRTNSGYHLLGGSLQVTCTNTAPHPNAGSDRRQYMAIYINGIRADTSVINNDGVVYNYSNWPKPGNMTVYNSCLYDPEEPDQMQLGIVYEWNRGFTPNESQELFNVSVNKQPNPSLWGAMFQEPPITCDRNFGENHHFHQTHTTGQTNTSLKHICPINDWTTTKGIGMRRKWILASAAAPEPIPLPPLCGRQVQFTLDGPSTTTFVVPPGVTFIYAECIGGGGDGDDAGLTVGGQGGGGGGYGAIGLTVSPGDTFSVVSGGPGITSTFGTGPDAQGDGGSTPAGGTVNIGSFTANGQDGDPGSTPNGGDGGAAPGGGNGGAGGAAATNGSPGVFPGGGGGGGGAASADGALGAAGQVIVTYASTYGLRGDIHQTHSTGQTNYSIMHCTPLNQYTTTKGIGMRRKYILDVNPSDLRVTQEYAEVFNVDPPTPRIRVTQFYFEVMDQPPAQAGWTSPAFRRRALIAAGLEPNPPSEPFTAKRYLRMVYRAAGLTAPVVPPPIEGCSVCVGRYKVRVQQYFTGTGQTINRTQTLLERGLQYCHCNGRYYPAGPYNPEFLEESLYPPPGPPGPPIVYDEPMTGPPFPIMPPIPPMVPPLPPPCPNNPPTLPITNLGVFHIVNQSDIDNADIDAQIILMQEQIDNSFAPYWGVTCTLVRSDATLLGIGYNIYIRNGDADMVACGYHIDKYFGLQKIGRVFPQYNSCQNWQNTLDHEVLEMLGDPTPFHNVNLGPLVTFLGKQGRFIVEVCDPVAHVTYNSGKLENFVYPSWFIPGSPCPWDRLGVLPGPMTFKPPIGFLGFLSVDEGWLTVRGDPPAFAGG
jgi:hypothetical protein